MQAVTVTSSRNQPSPVTPQSVIVVKAIRTVLPALWKTAGAIYYYELQDHPGALRCFRRALSLEPDPAERARLEELIRELQG